MACSLCYDVDEASGDGDDFYDGLSGERGGDLRVLQRLLSHLVGGERGGHHDADFRLAADLHEDLVFLDLQVGFVDGRPLRKGDGGLGETGC